MICWPWPVVEFSVRGNARRIVPAVGPVSQIGGIAVSTSTPFYTGAVRPLSISRQKLPIHVAGRILLHCASFEHGGIDHFRLCWFHALLLCEGLQYCSLLLVGAR